MTPSTITQEQSENTSLGLPANWLQLSPDEKAFAAAYVENSYSISAASEAVGISIAKCKSMLATPTIRKAVFEIQSAVADIDFLNEKWVKEQLLKLYPKLIGEEEVPLLDSSGMQINVKKFYPEAAIKVLEYVTPKTAGGLNVNINLGSANISQIPTDRLEKMLQERLAQEKIINE